MRRVLQRGLTSALLGVARCSSRRAGLALVYHRVGDPAGDRASELVPALGTGSFEAQLRYLRSRYRLVPASGLFAAAMSRRRGERFPVAVTFDDDLASHRRIAMPLLQRLGFPATFFLCGASLREPLLFWWERLQIAFDRGIGGSEVLAGARGEGAIQPGPGRAASIHEVAAAVEALPPPDRDRLAARLGSLLGPDPAESGMRAEDVAAMAAAGFEIGFHTVRHDRLPALDEEPLSAAMARGRAALEAIIGRRLRLIAYPHGAADPRVAAAARAAGYEFGFTTEPVAVSPSTDPLMIGRLDPVSIPTGDFAVAVFRTLDPQREHLRQRIESAIARGGRYPRAGLSRLSRRARR